MSITKFIAHKQDGTISFMNGLFDVPAHVPVAVDLEVFNQGHFDSAVRNAGLRLFGTPEEAKAWLGETPVITREIKPVDMGARSSGLTTEELLAIIPAAPERDVVDLSAPRVRPQPPAPESPEPPAAEVPVVEVQTEAFAETPVVVETSEVPVDPVAQAAPAEALVVTEATVEAPVETPAETPEPEKKTRAKKSTA